MASKPRWLSKIIEALAVPENSGKVVYQVATVDSDGKPHVRSQVHRSFMIPKSSPNLPLLVTSSDIRTQKIAQMFSTSSVEICWWLEGSQDQFRISGISKVITPPEFAFRNTIPAAEGSLAMAAVADSGEAEREDGESNLSGGKFDWDKKRREVFEAMKPAMKATWCAPKAPGSTMSSYDEANTWRTKVPYFKELKTEEDKKKYEYALSNFAMVVVEPLEVDWVQLGEHPNRRTLFTRKDEAGGSVWVEDILVP
ncbi:hypothetical protein BC835DRAFT_1406441 [Cytidiella melzeri]|nr:hypothetical protein BC835DRAFT_1406441 [Cytidiella melzeri]